MSSKRRIEYRTKLLILDGSAEYLRLDVSNTKIQDSLNDPEMHKGGFELDNIVSLSRGNKTFIVILIVFSRAARK